ncbi:MULTISPECIES: cbb3-type cytochrome c oxidase subunit 3 [unclassified Rhodoferax]|nr:MULTISPECIES: cbb3-type cytochrome c oxidase subunit 3 [Rhodoferax]
MEIDVNTARVVVTLLSFVMFIGIMVWAYSSKNASEFDEAGKLPFDQD